MADRFDVACVDVLSNAAFLSDRALIKAFAEYRCIDDMAVARVARLTCNNYDVSYAASPRCRSEEYARSELTALMDAVGKMDCAHQHPCDDWGAFSD